jgi:threonine aldolase
MERQGAPIDLRSDTVTRPTPQMYEAIADAPLGDDGLDGDPTAVALEDYAAGLLGKEAGVYFPSATMANLAAIMAQAGRQEVVLAHDASHIHEAESGGAALSGVVCQGIAGEDGAMDCNALADALASNRSKLRAALVCLETSHNSAGGAVLPLAHMAEVAALADRAGAFVHVDGARLFNASIALGVPPSGIARHADTVTICLSKGLSAPMGAVLAGPRQTCVRARALRRALGGNQRQVGIAAAAGLVALRTMVERLADDHRRAGLLADGVASAGLLLANRPQTNIVQIDTTATGRTAAQWADALRAAGVLVRPWGRHLLRCVTHRHISDDDIGEAVAAFRACLAASLFQR